MKKIKIQSLYYSIILLSLLVTTCKKRPPGPNLISLSPEQGSVGTKITIDGKNLYYFDKAFLGNIEVEQEPTIISNGERMELYVPVNVDLGVVDIYLTYEDGRSNSLEFKVITGMTTMTGNDTPVINMLATVYAGCELQIQGQNLNTITEVLFHVDLQAEILSQSATQLIVRVPDDATTGTMILYAPTDTVTLEVQVSSGDEPLIDRILPTGNNLGGPVIVYGENLDLVSQILLGDVEQGYFEGNSSFLKFHIPVSESIENQIVPLRFKTAQGCFTQAIDFRVGNSISAQSPVGGNNSVNIVIPNVPSGITLPSINNAWTLIKQFWTDDPIMDFLFLGSGIESGTDSVYLIDGNDTLATYSENGSFLEVIYDGQLYFGALDDSYPDFNPGDAITTPLRFVLTPQDFGDQIELIKPYVIEVGPSFMVGNEFTIKGRFFSESDEFEIEVQVFDTNSNEVPLPTNNSIEFIDKTTIKFLLQDNLPQGDYHLILKNENQFGAPLSNIFPFSI